MDYRVGVIVGVGCPSNGTGFVLDMAAFSCSMLRNTHTGTITQAHILSEINLHIFTLTLRSKRRGSSVVRPGSALNIWIIRRVETPMLHAVVSLLQLYFLSLFSFP
jgi:hypothetical protein